MQANCSKLTKMFPVAVVARLLLIWSAVQSTSRLIDLPIWLSSWPICPNRPRCKLKETIWYMDSFYLPRVELSTLRWRAMQYQIINHSILAIRKFALGHKTNTNTSWLYYITCIHVWGRIFHLYFYLYIDNASEKRNQVM